MTSALQWCRFQAYTPGQKKVQCCILPSASMWSSFFPFSTETFFSHPSVPSYSHSYTHTHTQTPTKTHVYSTLSFSIFITHTYALAHPQTHSFKHTHTHTHR